MTSEPLPSRDTGDTTHETGPLAQAIRTLCSPASGGTRSVTLSEREGQIIRLVARDLSNKEISANLGISQWTVATHLRHIFATIGVHSKAAMVARVIELAWDPPTETPAPADDDTPGGGG